MAFDGYLNRAIAHLVDEYERHRADPIVAKRTVSGYLMLAPASADVDNVDLEDSDEPWISGQSVDLERWA